MASKVQSPVKQGKVVPAPGDDLTLKMVRDAIPAHYFQQNTAKGFMYLARDLVQVAVTAAIHYYAVVPAADAAISALGGGAAAWWAVQFVAWNLYWFVQGLNCTGIWVLAHECGHRGFSPSVFVNDAVGMVLHSALLVPYHSWRISHGTHHKHTNHLDQDTVFIPEKVGKKTSSLREAVKESPIASLWGIFIMLTLGWPGYLIANLSGQTYNRRCNHFEPASPLFRVNQRPDIVKSDIGLGVALGVIGYCCSVFGAVEVLKWYAVPYLWCNHWLVLITYLQHTDVRLPHYSPEHWNFLRGALATVDRDFGALMNWWFHHIQDSHVVHHLFSTMPFYNAKVVTEKHIKPVLGPYYCFDDRRIAPSLFESWRNCRYVVPEEGVAYFKY